LLRANGELNCPSFEFHVITKLVMVGRRGLLVVMWEAWLDSVVKCFGRLIAQKRGHLRLQCYTAFTILLPLV